MERGVWIVLTYNLPLMYNMSLSTLVPQYHVLTSGVGSAMTWSNVLTLSTANCSTVNASSMVTNSIGANVVTLNSTLSVSTLTARAVNVSTITGSSISSNTLTLSLVNASTQNTQIYQVATTNPTTSYTAIQASHVSTGTTNNALVLNPSGGNVGVGTTAPATNLNVIGNTSIPTYPTNTVALFQAANSAGVNDAGIMIGSVNGNTPYLSDYGSASNGMLFYTNKAERMRILANGNVGIGTSNPGATFEVYRNGGVGGTTQLNVTSVAGGATTTNSSIVNLQIQGAGAGLVNNTISAQFAPNSSGGTYSLAFSPMGTTVMSALGSGNVGIGTLTPSATLHVVGSLAKSSGTFDIAHPLHPDTNKRLVHSFIEGPRCDLIYRGKTTLVDGSAVVNIDKECTHSPECAMDDGTFEALCDNPQVFLQNNKTFDRVRGVVTGATLTITCESQAAVEIEWMVIAERADPFIKQWDRTNPDGYLITQYDAPAAPSPSSGVEAAPSPSSEA